MKIFFFILLLTTSCANTGLKSLFAGFNRVAGEDSIDSHSQHYQNGELHIFYSTIMTDLDSAEAERLFQNRKNYLKSLFQVDKDPYFGKTSKSDECLKGLVLEKIPVIGKLSDSVIFNLPASDNFILGLCNPALEKYDAQISFIYCKNSKTFYEIKYFQPKYSQVLRANSPEEICEK